MLTIYGIKQCDTVKKALKWLDNNNIEHTFHDYRKEGIEDQMVERWINEFGWQALVNKRSTTWRNLDAEAKDNLGPETVKALLLENPTLIKRPIVEGANEPLIGFKEESYKKAISG